PGHDGIRGKAEAPVISYLITGIRHVAADAEAIGPAEQCAAYRLLSQDQAHTGAARAREEDAMPSEQGDASGPLQTVIDDFLLDLAQANRPQHTRRAYASDLHQFADWHAGPLATINAQCLREFFASLAHLSAGTRARKQASLSTFFHWASRQGLLNSNPMTY